MLLAVISLPAVDPQRPPVTIVNPNAPTHSGDLLESGPDAPRWRPTQRWVPAVAIALAALGTLVGATFGVLHLRHERALDRAALADVEVSAVYDQDSPSTAVKIFNDGSFPVTLLSASVDAPGYGDSNPGLLGPGESGSFVLDDSRACTPGVLSSQPQHMVLSGKTYRGQRFARSIPLDSDALDAALSDDQDRCGYQPPEDAFTLDVTSVREVGADVVVRAALGNQSVLPLTLVGFEAWPGLRVTTAATMPISLPEAPDVGDLQTVLVTLRLHVSNCRDLNETGGLPLPFDPMGWVHLRRGSTTARAPLVFEPVQFQDGQTDGPSPTALLFKRACNITLPDEFAPPGG